MHGRRDKNDAQKGHHTLNQTVLHPTSVQSHFLVGEKPVLRTTPQGCTGSNTVSRCSKGTREGLSKLGVAPAVQGAPKARLPLCTPLVCQKIVNISCRCPCIQQQDDSKQ